MNRNFIDFDPWRKSLGLLQNLALLVQDLVLTPQPLQLGCRVLLALLGRIVDLTLATAIQLVAQDRQADPDIRGNLTLDSAAGQSKPYSLILKLFRKACLGHGDPPGL
jgi:hypothetical protein